MDRRRQRQRCVAVAVLALAVSLTGMAAGPARAAGVGAWVCDPQLNWFSPGGPSVGGSDGIPQVLAPSLLGDGEDDGQPFLACSGNAASGLSIAKTGDTWAMVGRYLTRMGVWFGGKPVTLTVNTDELLEFVLPPRPDGEYPFEVHLPGGQVWNWSAVIYRSPGPAVTNVVDLSGPSGGPATGAAGDEILVTGARLFESSIRVDDLPVPIIHGSNSANALRFALPALPAGSGGTHRLDVSSFSGVTSTTFTPAAPRPKGPVITSLENDDDANLGDGYVGASMTVRGWGLAGSQVRVDGVPATVVADFDDVLTYLMPQHAPGEVDVVVTNRLGRAVTGSGYLNPARMPRITSVTRAGAPVSVVHAGDLITVTGSHLTPACLTVDDAFQNDEGQIVSSSATKIVFTIGAHPPAQDVPLRLVWSSGRAVAFVNYDLPVSTPVLSGLSAASGSTAGGEVRVRGTGLSPLTVKASVDGRSVPAAYVDATTIKLLLPRHAAGPGSVTVTVANGHRSVTATFPYRYTAPR
jgi:hypothetical protein